MKATPKTVTLLGIPFENLSESQAKQRIASLLANRDNAKIFTPNPQFLARAQKEPHLSELLRSADLLLPDGVGITLTARLGGTPLQTRMTGIDTAEWILSYAAPHGLSVFLLGAKPGVAEQARERLCRQFPALRICGTHHGYFNKYKDSADNRQILSRIRQAEPDILFVCFGFPEQERWIGENAESLPSLRLSMGLGGSFDIWSGNLRRAPQVWQNMGLEWLWRSFREPRRLPSVLRSTKTLCQIFIQQRRESKAQ